MDLKSDSPNLIDRVAFVQLSNESPNVPLLGFQKCRVDH
jgi:hypothetical protein